MVTNTPPGVNREDFLRATDEMKRIVTEEWVFTEEAVELPSYTDQYNVLPEGSMLPGAAVAPKSVEEIKGILSIARQYKIPLWTISTGKNFAYGGPAPRRQGYVVLDLARMNRILEVNERHGYAVVEPGVSYFQFYNYLQKNDYGLWPDPAAPGWGSVLGNTLEHGAGYTPYGFHFMTQCGMEVVLADGRTVQTGMRGLNGQNLAGTYKYGWGPRTDGIFTQSNFGVVTKMGVWLMPEPPSHKSFMVSFPREDDLEQIVELTKPLRINRIIPNSVVIAHLLWEAGITSSKSDYYQGEGATPRHLFRSIADDRDLGMWNLYGALYGTETTIENNWQIVRNTFSKVKGAEFYTVKDRKGDPGFTYRAELMRGKPNMTEFNVMNWVPNGAHVDFSVFPPTQGSNAVELFQLISRRCRENGFDYIGEFVILGRPMGHILMLTFDRNNDKKREQARELFAQLIQEAANRGYGEYRTHLHFMDLVAQTYDHNDHALWRLHERIKDKLDPEGILSPGKQGIWPRRFREKQNGNQ